MLACGGGSAATDRDIGAHSATVDPTPAPAADGNGISSVPTGATPARLTFVSRDGNPLWLGAEPFVVVGSNVYWLAANYTVDANGKKQPSSHANIREAFATAKAMGPRRSGRTISASRPAMSPRSSPI